MAAGVFGYLGYDMVRHMEELPAPNPDPLGLPDAIMVRPTLIIVFDAVKDTITVVTPVRPTTGVSASAAFARASERLSSVVDALDQPLDKSAANFDPGPVDVAQTSNTSAGRISRDGVAREGIHRRRRHLPGRALAALRSAVLHSGLFALSRAAAGQSGAVSLLSRLRRLRRRRIEPGNTRALTEGPHHHPSDRRYAAARRDTARGHRARARAARRSRRSAPSI